jgi:hypothetical protein
MIRIAITQAAFRSLRAPGEDYSGVILRIAAEGVERE